MTKRRLAVLIFGVAVSGSTAFASTASLPVGGSVSPVPSNGSTPSGTLEATISGSFISTPSSAFSGTYQAEVFLDPTTHDLDFYYKVSDAGPDALSRISIVDFTSAITRVAYLTSGGIAPSEADRNTAKTVGFDFFGSGHVLASGTSSDWLEIATNFKYYTSSTMFIQDGGQASVKAFAPSPVPEPLSMGLLGSGLAFLGILRFRRSRS